MGPWKFFNKKIEKKLHNISECSLCLCFAYLLYLLVQVCVHVTPVVSRNAGQAWPFRL